MEEDEQQQVEQGLNGQVLYAVSSGGPRAVNSRQVGRRIAVNSMC